MLVNCSVLIMSTIKGQCEKLMHMQSRLWLSEYSYFLFTVVTSYAISEKSAV